MKTESLVTASLFLLLFAFVDLVLSATQSLPGGNCYFSASDGSTDGCYPLPDSVRSSGVPDFTMVFSLFDNSSSLVEETEYFFLDGGWSSSDNSFQLAIAGITTAAFVLVGACGRRRAVAALQGPGARMGVAGVMLVTAMLFFAAVGVDASALSEWGTLCEDPFITDQFGGLISQARDAALSACPDGDGQCSVSYTFDCDADRFWLTLCFNFLLAMFLTVFACLLAYAGAITSDGGDDPFADSDAEAGKASLLEQEHGGVPHFLSDEEDAREQARLAQERPPAQGQLDLSAYQPVASADAIELQEMKQEDIDDL